MSAITESTVKIPRDDFLFILQVGDLAYLRDVLPSVPEGKPPRRAVSPRRTSVRNPLTSPLR